MNTEKIEKYIYSALIASLVIAFYYLFPDFCLYLFNVLKFDPSKFSNAGQVIYLISISVLILIIICLFYFKEIKKEFVDFKNNFKKYYLEYKKYWFIMISLMVTSSFIVSFFASGIAQNEALIRETLSSGVAYIIYISLSCILIAPLTEEFIFRKCIKKIFPNSILFIILSGLIFGSSHVLGLATTWTDYLFIIPYSVPGFVLAYTYQKSGNIFVSVGIHMFHNTVLLCIQLLMMFGGSLW